MATFVVTTAADAVLGENLSLRMAVAAANANPGDDVIVFDDTLEGATIRLTFGEIEITDAVMIDGQGVLSGVPGVTITGDASADDVLDADGFTDVAASVTGEDRLDDNSRIFNIGPDAGTVLYGLALTGGRTTGDNADQSDSTYSGGAIRTESDLLAFASVFTGNSTMGYGARGGAIGGTFGKITLNLSTVSGNLTEGERALGGGTATSGYTELIKSTVSGNATLGDNADGGGVHTVDGFFSDSRIAGNTTAGALADGGGVNSFGGYLRFVSSTVSDNSTAGFNAFGGGIRTTSSSQLTLLNSVVSGNTGEGTASGGGGILAANILLVNSTVADNRLAVGSDGGGIFANGPSFAVNSTITGNATPGNGGGVRVGADDTFTLVNSIVAGNQAGGAGDDLAGTGSAGNMIATLGTNIIGSAPSGFAGEVLGGTVITVDGADQAALESIFASVGPGPNGGAISGLLADNGGPTRTVALAAVPDNPALDAADPAGEVNLLEGPLRRDLNDDGDTADLIATIADIAFDARGEGFDRDVDLPGVGGTPDLGAFEVQALNLPPVAQDDQAITDQFVPIFSLDVLINDSDGNGDTLMPLDPGATQGGRAFANEDGTLAYAPRPDFTGVDRFDYTVSDGNGGTDTAQVEVAVLALDEDIVCARTVAYLYEAAFDRFPDLPGLNFWIDFALDGTLTKEEIAEFFLTVPEFVNLYGPVDELSDADLIAQLFLNTLDRPGDQAGIDFWEGVLADPGFSRAEMLLAFAQSPENQLGSPDIVTLEETTPGEWEFVV